jgi:hypothetical protein
VSDEIAIRLYRVAKTFPPADGEYLSPEQQGRKLRPGLTDEQRRSWDALSCWDSADGARKIGRLFPRSGSLIVRYDIPATCRHLTWEQTIEPGHYDLRGDMEELKRYLAADFEPVRLEEAGE